MNTRKGEKERLLEAKVVRLKEVEDSDDQVDEFFDVEPGKTSMLSLLCGITFFPCTLACSWFTVQENQEMVALNFGKYTGVIREPGIHFKNFFGRELIPISKAKLTTELPITKVIDKSGNPVMVSGVVFYYFRDTKKAALDILRPEEFVKDQATAVMKQIVSQYPYEVVDINSGDDDESSDESIPCLKRDPQVISAALVKELQKQVNVAGAKIDTFRFNEISYASEVSASLLKKQQANAIVTARSTLVEGAVNISYSAISRLDKRGIVMDEVNKARLISNLLVVVCAEEQVQPALILGTT